MVKNEFKCVAKIKLVDNSESHVQIVADQKSPDSRLASSSVVHCHGF